MKETTASMLVHMVDGGYRPEVFQINSIHSAAYLQSTNLFVVNFDNKGVPQLEPSSSRPSDYVRGETCRSI